MIFSNDIIIDLLGSQVILIRKITSAVDRDQMKDCLISYNSAFATSVLPERKSLRTTPLNIVLSSGSPDPAAEGATRATMPALNITSIVGSVDLV